MPADSPEDRRYRSFSSYLREIFGCRVHKVGLDAGFTCPNRDGTCGEGGCTYCLNESFSHHTDSRRSPPPLEEQLGSGIEHMRRRFKAEKFIAYFQAYTGTHAPVERLWPIYDTVRRFPEVAGLFVSTRPDCVSDDVLELIASYSKDYLTWLELGVQSARDDTLRRINRGHDTAAGTDAIRRAHERGLPVCAHVILGLPGEGRDDMLATADYLAGLGVESVKLHCLHVMEGTSLANELRRGELDLLSREDYVRLACDFLERLPPDTVIQRLAVDVRGDKLLAPGWVGRDKLATVRLIEEELARRDSRQGALLG